MKKHPKTSKANLRSVLQLTARLCRELTERPEMITEIHRRLDQRRGVDILSELMDLSDQENSSPTIH